MSSSKTQKAKSVVDNIDLNEVQSQVQSLYSKGKNLKDKHEEEINAVSSIVSDIRKKEKSIDAEEKDTDQKISEAEETGNPEELAAAEKEGEDEEEKEKEVEGEIDKAEEGVREDVKNEGLQEENIHELQVLAEKQIKAANEGIQNEIRRLKQAQGNNSKASKINTRDFKSTEKLLSLCLEATDTVEKALELLGFLIEEFEEDEEAEGMIERLTRKAESQSQHMEEEAAEFAKDFQQLQDQKHEQIAEQEVQHAEQLEKHAREEGQKESQTDKTLQDEITEYQDLLQSEQALERQLEQVKGELQTLETIMEGERSRLKSLTGNNPPIGDLQQAINRINNILNRDETRTEKISRKVGKLRDGMSSLPFAPSASSGFGGGMARAGLTVTKFAGLAAVVLIILFIMYGGGLI